MKTLMICALMLLCLNAAPNNPRNVNCLEVCVTATVNRAIMDDATATLYENNVPVQDLSRPNYRYGFRFSLKSNRQYTIIIRKEGYYPRKISFDTSLPDSVSLALIFEFCARVEMIPLSVKLNSDFDDFPIALVSYDPGRDVFDAKEKYTAAVKKGLLAPGEKSRMCFVRK